MDADIRAVLGGEEVNAHIFLVIIWIVAFILVLMVRIGYSIVRKIFYVITDPHGKGKL